MSNVIVEVRVLNRSRDDPYHVCIITADGMQSTYNEEFASLPEAEAFAAGLREGLKWFAEGGSFSPPVPAKVPTEKQAGEKGS